MAGEGFERRWTPLWHDEAWARALTGLMAGMSRSLRDLRLTLVARVPPKGHWVFVPDEEGLPFFLGPEEEPFRRLSPAYPRLRVPPLTAAPALRHWLGGNALGVYPLYLRSQIAESGSYLAGALLARSPQGVLPARLEPAWADALGYLLAERVQAVLIDSAMGWIAAQGSPVSAEDWEPALAELATWFGGDHWCLLGISHESERDVWNWGPVAEWGHPPGMCALWTAFANLPAARPASDLAVQAAARERLLFVHDLGGDPSKSPFVPWRGRLLDLGFRSLIVMPLGDNGTDWRGLLAIFWKKVAGWDTVAPSPRPWEALRRLMAGWWREMAAAHHLVYDPLTGVYNRRGLVAAWREAPESGLLAILDLDGFHLVNDGFGHLAGDEVLRGVGMVLRQTAAELGGSCGRWGGDEFLLLLPAEVDWATLEAEISRRLDQMAVERSWPYRVGASGGAVRWREQKPRLDEAVRAADRALYAVKRSGKGRVLYAGELEVRS